MSRPTVLAAGGVLWRSAPADPEVAVVHRPRIGARLTTVRYRVTSGGRPANKVVTYWSMREDGGSFRSGRELDEMEWLSLPAARRRVTSAADRSVLDVFARTVRDTEPLLLGATDLLSADLPACTEMLAPFAAATGLTVRRESRLTGAGFEGNEREVSDRVRRDASSAAALVVCGRQRVVSGLLRRLGDRAGVRPPNETAVKKGGWWLLHHRNGTISSFERHEPAA